jgi:KDO2-lipid IV(A) lauroyltransferase
MLITRIVLKMRQFKDWLIATLAFGFLRVLKLFPMDPAIHFADRLARLIGPRTSRHKLVLYNIKRAFPEKTEDEVLALAMDSWGHLGRLAAEYIFLDYLFDFDPMSDKAGRIEVEGTEKFKELLENRRPFIVFTGHTANFELLPVASSAFGLDVTVMFRPPNNPYIAKKLHSFRAGRMGKLVPSHAGSAFALARELEKGNGVGVLVDQKFAKGLKTEFFGNPVQTNPLLAKLVRQFHCDVFPARCIRLPNNRYRLVLEDRIEIPTDERGSVDVQKTAQLLNDKVESWVRENPAQWLWYHDRWNVKRDI